MILKWMQPLLFPIYFHWPINSFTRKTSLCSTINYLVFDTVSNDRLTPVPQQKEDDLIPYIKTKKQEQLSEKYCPFMNDNSESFEISTKTLHTTASKYAAILIAVQLSTK